MQSIHRAGAKLFTDVHDVRQRLDQARREPDPWPADTLETVRLEAALHELANACIRALKQLAPASPV